MFAVPEAPDTQRIAAGTGSHGAVGCGGSVRGHCLPDRCVLRAYARMRVLVFPVVVIVIAPAERSLFPVAVGLLDGGSPALLCLCYVPLQLL